MNVFKYLVFLGVFIFSWVYADEKITLTDPNKGIAVSTTSPEITIILKSNPSTGYSWFLSHYNHHLITPKSHRFVRNTNPYVLGAPGFEIWKFSVNSQAFHVPRVSELRFKYLRPWSISSHASQQSFTILFSQSEKMTSLKPSASN